VHVNKAIINDLTDHRLDSTAEVVSNTAFRRLTLDAQPESLVHTNAATPKTPFKFTVTDSAAPAVTSTVDIKLEIK